MPYTHTSTALLPTAPCISLCITKQSKTGSEFYVYLIIGLIWAIGVVTGAILMLIWDMIK